MVNFWAKVKSATFHVKLLWVTFGKFGLLFNSASRHSECEPVHALILVVKLFKDPTFDTIIGAKNLLFHN